MKKPPPLPRNRYDEDEETVVLRGAVADPLALAMQAVMRAPELEASWDELEKVGREASRFDDVAATYRAVLARACAPEIAMRLGERAIAFHEEWAPDEDAVLALLERLEELDPTASWVFARLSLALATAQRWEELLSLYDRGIAATTSQERRSALLTEAARVAKDCAGQSERAIAYMTQLFALKPNDAKGAATLERLLKQQRRWRELIDLWTTQLERLAPAAAAEQRARIATTWLTRLSDPTAALSAIRPIVDDAGARALVLPVLGGVVAAAGVERAVRDEAFTLLAARCDDEKDAAVRIAALRAMLDFAEGARRVELHTELAARLTTSGDAGAAHEHLVALLLLDGESFGAEALREVLAGKGAKVGATTMALEATTARRLAHEAAAQAAREAGETARAVALYRALLEATKDDEIAIDALAKLYERGASRADLLELRRHQLGLARDVEARLELRLQIARLLAEEEDDESAVVSLRENLAERRGHAATMEALAVALKESEREAELARTFDEEARAVDEEGRPLEAAGLWAAAAEVAERALGDRDRAATWLERAAEREASPAVLDALARIEEARGNAERVVAWLEKRHRVASRNETADVSLRLADALLAAGANARAREVLEEAHREHPARADLLERLARALSATKSYEDLVAVLLRGAEHATDDPSRVRLRVRAASLLSEELADPWRAADALRPALSLAPDDGTLRAAMAHSLRRAGRLLEARDLLIELVESYGKRRPRERAEAHYQLACIHDSLARPDLALVELELAASIDAMHLRAQKLLGDLALAAGQHERADRAYTAVMLVLARDPSARPAGAPSLVATLFDLYRVAERRGLPRASENLASAFEIAAESDEEARALERLFEEAEEHELLLRALEQRLSRAKTASERAETQRRLGATRERVGDTERALASWLSALDDAPDDETAHARASALAASRKETAVYLRKLESLLSVVRERGDLPELASLLISLATAKEASGALDEAATFLRQAEDTGERLPLVWRAIARVARARGDKASATAALRKLDAGDGNPIEQRQILLTLAEMELEDEPEVALATLERAIELGAGAELAKPLLERATELPAVSARALEALLSLARTSGEPSMLLDALVRGAKRDDATPELLREAATLAGELRDAREEELLSRASSVSDAEVATWSLGTLARGAKAAGDARGAVRWYEAAAKTAPAHEARDHAKSAAELLAGALGDLPLAVDAYQALFDEDPSDAATAAALVETARKLGERARLDRALAGLIDAVFDAKERSALRMERVELLRADGKLDDAMQLLSAVLFDEPDHAGAATLLAKLLKAEQRTEELAELYSRQIDLARDRADVDAVARLSMRLAETLRETKPDHAIVALRDAIALAGRRRGLLRALLGVLPDDDPERPDLMEHLLAAEQEADAPTSERLTLSLALADARLATGDAAGAERALLHAHALGPGEVNVRTRLTALADDLVKATQGEGRGSLVIEGHASALVRAASLFRALADAPRVAAALRDAHALDPDDAQTSLALARALFEIADHDGAFAVLDTMPDEPQTRIGALRLRAEVLSRESRHTEESAVLERARAAGDTSAEQPLIAALRASRKQAMAIDDGLLTRKLTGRLATLLAARGAHAEAIELLEEVLSRVASQEVPSVALEIDVLARAIDRPEASRMSLEMALEADPRDANVRARLRSLYELAGAHRELAGLLVLDARNTKDDVRRFEALREVGRLRLVVLGEPTAAIGPLSDARALRPSDQDVTSMLVDALLAASMHDDAAQLLRDAIKEHGGKRSRALALLQRKMASVLEAQGDASSALAWLLSAFESHPQSGEIAGALADAALARGDDEIAGRALRAITLMRGETPFPRGRAYEQLAAIAARGGDPRKAMTLAKKALSEDPESSSAKALIESLEGNAR